ncbi:hypothetical protein [Chengkuizengella axinellae]|uniref:Zinc ribbon domain-containing protein n=1 Tax=Chengkuizengella axinellae TaxID=3064388 RepID=A0ABT9IWX8_9BACL|nr:hypothetical protein [Chengkuizengella sp. 2205SS18-9]MDP5273874.1 hypothetical protein [Chengkuizengella sp. 2205SS18-9]
MATVVLHKPSGKRYILLGTGFGAYKASRPGFLGGDLFPHEEQDEIPVASVSDEFGNIQWVYTDELIVVEVDGKSIGDYAEKLIVHKKPIKQENIIEYETCPACNSRIHSEQMECPSCGLTLIDEN